MRRLLLALAPAWVFAYAGAGGVPVGASGGVGEWETDEAIPHAPAPPLSPSAGVSADTPRAQLRVEWPTFAGDPGSLKYSPLAGVALPPRLGAGGSSGPLATAGRLVFVAGGASKLYALDAKSGKVLWEGDLGGRGFANPMTYRTAGGRQVVVVAVGAGENARLVAFGLPQPLRAQR